MNIPVFIDDVVALVGYALRYTPSWSGRGTRKELVVTTLISTFVFGSLIWLGERGNEEMSAIGSYFGLAMATLSISSAVIRRLHDTGRGPFAFIVLLAPYFGIIAFIVLLLLPGDEGQNGYGPPPRQP